MLFDAFFVCNNILSGCRNVAGNCRNLLPLAKYFKGGAGVYITYPLLIEFLYKKENIAQRDMAKALSISRSNISRMISGELSQLSRSVEEESFYKKLFCGKRIRIVSISSIGICRNARLRMTSLTLHTRSFCGTGQEPVAGAAAECHGSFLRLVLQRAEESRKANLVNDETSAPDISFAPLNYRLTEGFVGRTDLLQEISDVMKEHGFAVLCGIGGLGKSQTALRYAENGKRIKVYHQVQMVYFHQDLKMTIQEISFQGMKKYQKEEKAGDEGFRIRMDALKHFMRIRS